MKDEELLTINGGSGVSGVILTNILKALTICLELGRCLGSALSRSKTKKYCS